ncbi:MAG: RHS repeat-associated core domain-containing protein [Spirochaetales bacterium]|nr:RHS repeat-associated core domain-containing protein [Spirochaetales bacterium]
MYTGKELDEETGLYYYNARWYIAELYESTVHTILPNHAKLKEFDDPNIGRFTTEDPIRDGLNWYAYANNNPLKFVDPTGLSGEQEDSFPEDDLATERKGKQELLIPEAIKNISETEFGQTARGQEGKRLLKI